VISVSYTVQKNAIRIAPWSVLHLDWNLSSADPPTADSLHTYMYGGLSGEQTFIGKPGDKNLSAEDPVAWKDCQVFPPPTGGKYYPFCQACDKASAAIVSMCSLALIAAFCAFFCHLLRSTCDYAFAKNLAVLTGLISVVFGIGAVVIALPCKTAVDDWIATPITGIAAVSKEFNLDYSIGFGNGAKVVIASFVMIFVVSILSLLTPVASTQEVVLTPVAKTEAEAKI